MYCNCVNIRYIVSCACVTQSFSFSLYCSLSLSIPPIVSLSFSLSLSSSVGLCLCVCAHTCVSLCSFWKPLPVCQDKDCVTGCVWCGAFMCPPMEWHDCGQRFYCPFCGKLSEGKSCNWQVVTNRATPCIQYFILISIPTTHVLYNLYD